MQKWQRQRQQQQQRAQMKEKVASAKTTIYCSSCCKQCQLYVQLHYDYIFCAKCVCVYLLHAAVAHLTAKLHFTFIRNNAANGCSVAPRLRLLLLHFIFVVFCCAESTPS